MRAVSVAATGLAGVALGAFALLLSMGCTRCGGTGDSAHVFYPGNGTCAAVAEAAGSETLALLPFYAALAASAYNTDPSTREPVGKIATTLEAFCDDRTSFYLPAGLEVLPPADYPALGPPRSGWDLGGLAYHVFAHRRTGKPTQVFIVFRGTDDAYGDLFSNLRWGARVLFFLNDEYDQVLRILQALGRVVHERYGSSAEIITVGHSLGGGLAQLAAYGFPWRPDATGVTSVYTFDPSPVTGYYSVPRELRERNAVGLRTYRVYDHGEVLAYLRLLMKALYPVTNENPAIIEARFNLLRGNVIKQHGMHGFTRAMWEAFGRKEPQLGQ